MRPRDQDSIRALSDDDLDQAIDDTRDQIEALKATLKALKDEQDGRAIGVRVGDHIQVDGKTAIVVELYSSWPMVRFVNPKTGKVGNTRHLYNWQEYKAGKKESPL